MSASFFLLISDYLVRKILTKLILFLFLDKFAKFDKVFYSMQIYFGFS